MELDGEKKVSRIPFASTENFQTASLEIKPFSPQRSCNRSDFKWILIPALQEIKRPPLPFLTKSKDMSQTVSYQHFLQLQFKELVFISETNCIYSWRMKLS